MARVHPTAVVGQTSTIDSTAHIGPNATLGDSVKVGARSVIGAGAFIGDESEIGEDCMICPNVTMYRRTVAGNRVKVHSGTVIGSDGFGYFRHEGRHVKIPQVGNVVIEDDVEIGSNVSIDRATMGATTPVSADGVSTATPLSLLKLQGQMTPPLHLIIGNVPGSLGETSAIAILLGAAYLLYKGTISWHIPASYVGSVLLLSFVLGENPVFHVFAGGLLLGAFFMATDVVTSPVTKWGRLIFGVGAGVVTMLVRAFGAYPEGVCYSILLMNGLTPLIDRFTSRTYQPAG